MGRLFKAIIDFFKKIFGTQDTVEPTVDSGNTTTSATTTPTPEPQNGGNEPQNEPIEPQNDGNEPQNDGNEPIVEPVSNVKILIDNGHGDNTAGKRSPWCANGAYPEIEFYEYSWNREIAKRVVDELKEKGYDAELIVTEITDISLAERVRRVNEKCTEYGASNVIFISVHANAAGSGKEWMNGRGWSVYTSKGNTKSDDLAEYLYREAAKNFVGMKLRPDNSDGDSDQEADFYVLKKTYCTAVLTENFFYDNVDDVQYILSEEGKNAVVKTHVDGIINYISQL